MDGMRTTMPAKLSQFQPVGVVPLIFRCGVVAILANRASERHHDAILFSFACHDFLLLRLSLVRGF
jgi:hypothetical protein